jgi:hypothetical protein
MRAHLQAGGNVLNPSGKVDYAESEAAAIRAFLDGARNVGFVCRWLLPKPHEKKAVAG